MIRIINKRDCCGCEACIQICPKHCILGKVDSEGFMYPVVNQNECVECGLCETVCPVHNQFDEKDPLKSFAAQNNEDKDLLASSSGGVFVLLAKDIINKKGVVFGAKFDTNWTVIHSYTDTLGGVKEFMGSKYTQSRIGDCYKDVKTILESGRLVMFSGTSCQVAGLKRFLRKDYPNLLTVDVICHGVPSPMVWQDYLGELKENARKGENTVSLRHDHQISEEDALLQGGNVDVESISFRDKRLGWKKFSFALTLAEATADGKKNSVSLSHIHREDAYMMAFIRNLILRPSCYHCPAKGGRSNSDLTIADFWGVQRIIPEFNDDKGCSLVITNTSKGLKLFERLNLKSQEVIFENAIQGNGVYFHPVKPHCQRKKFFKAFGKKHKSVTYLLKYYTQVPIYNKCLMFLRRIASKVCREIRNLKTNNL